MLVTMLNLKISLPRLNMTLTLFFVILSQPASSNQRIVPHCSTAVYKYKLFCDHDNFIFSLLSLCHSNIRSFAKYLDEFSHWINLFNYDVFFLKETWLNSSHFNSLCVLPGYILMKKNQVCAQLWLRFDNLYRFIFTF